MIRDHRRAANRLIASWFRGKKGWFTEREEQIIANRVIRDDPSKGDMQYVHCPLQYTV